jgi:phage-related minor tail protein
MSDFVGDNFIICCNDDWEAMARDMVEKLEKITRWLKSCSLVVKKWNYDGFTSKTLIQTISALMVLILCQKR